MAGYKGFSMSNNAVDAYYAGEKPISKWTKADILQALGELSARYANVPAAALKAALLKRSSWHHTSSRYNKTDFYIVDIDMAERLSESDISALCKATAQEEPVKVTTRRVSYLVWGGSRKHPKATRYEAECEIVGNWAMTPHGKKSTSANGFEWR
jgi:hypothetical protein